VALQALQVQAELSGSTGFCQPQIATQSSHTCDYEAAQQRSGRPWELRNRGARLRSVRPSSQQCAATESCEPRRSSPEVRSRIANSAGLCAHAIDKTRSQSRMLNWLRRPDAKELGNEAFKEKNLDEAVLQYTRGLERCQGTAQTEERSKLLANRSAAHAKLGNYEAALADAEEASRLQPDWPKAWARKGKALTCLQRHKAAASSYARGLECALTLMQKNDERHKLCGNQNYTARSC
jgi:tetratricopeptide (TPR) repeat protein